MTATEYVVLVDTEDREIGVAEKLVAHRENRLHRAFSVFVFRQEKQGVSLLLQQRAAGKYHSAGLWTNTCCSHPRPGEDILTAGQRRLQEELGFVVPLRNVGHFIYHAPFENGLSEHELDHVLIGIAPTHLVIQSNPAEVDNIEWVASATLTKQLKSTPERFTPWFREALAIAEQGLRSV